MSLREKMYKKHRKGESRAHSLAHKYDARKLARVMSHVRFERLHGFESTKHKGAKQIPDAA
ncbi:MAG: hypothetical protein WAQ24_00540 [Candidatus Saccharimonadales bacterium]